MGLPLSNHNFEAAIGISTGQNAIGAGQITDSTDGLRASAGCTVKNATRQISSEPVHELGHNQDSRISSGSTIERSTYNFGNHPAPD